MNELPEKYYVHTNFPEEANDVAKYFNAMGRYFGTFSCNFYYPSANQMNGGRLHPKDEFPVYEYSEWKQKLKNPTVMDKLPDEYFIQCSTKEESNEAIKFVKKRTSWPVDVMWIHVAKHADDRPYDNLWDNLIPDRYKHYPIIPFAEWKKLINSPQIQIETNMEKKIIGYKFKQGNEVYREAAEKISNTTLMPSLEFKDLFAKGSMVFQALEKAGVLDLWFEPVYKQELKAGDWICFLKPFDGKDRGHITQITSVEPEAYKNAMGWIRYSEGGFRWEGNGYTLGVDFRKATSEEIEKYNAVKIGKFPLEIHNGNATFGCKTFSKDTIHVIRSLIIDKEINASIIIHGTIITAELINRILDQLK